MAKYLLTYHGELATFPEDPAELQAISDKWGEFYGSIGAGVVYPGEPVSSHRTAVGGDGSECDIPAPGLTGYTVITASDLAEATAVAKRCPVLAFGSTVQVSELVEM